MNKYSVFGRNCLLLLLLAIVIANAGVIKNTKTVSDPLCSKWDKYKTSCQQCASRCYFHPSSRKCTKVSDLCQTWNYKTGLCNTCVKGCSGPLRGICTISKPKYCSATNDNLIQNPGF